MSRVLMPRVLMGKRDDAFNPLSLSPDLWIPTFNPATTAMWQEAAQSTVADEDSEPVGYVTDGSGNGVSITQSTSTARMLLANDAGSGGNLWALEGVSDDYLITDLTPATALTMIVAFQADATNDAIIGSNGAGSTFCVMKVQNTTGYMDGLVGSQEVVGSVNVTGVPVVGIMRFNGTTLRLAHEFFSGGGIVDDFSSTQTGTPNTTVAMYLNAFNNNGSAFQPLLGDLFSVFVKKSALTDDEVTSVSSWMVDNAGVT